MLTTKKLEANASGKAAVRTSGQNRHSLPSPNKNVTRNVGRGGVVSLRTRPKQESTFKDPSLDSRRQGAPPSSGKNAQSRSGSTVGGRPVLMARDRATVVRGPITGGLREDKYGSPKKLTRTIKGEMSEAAKLDMELLNTRVNPVTVANG